MEVDIVRSISTKCFVVQRVGMGVVFMVEFAKEPSFVSKFRQPSLPQRVRLHVSEFDWVRKSFPVSEIQSDSM